MRRCGLQRSSSERGETAVLRWLVHIERMEGEWLVKKIYPTKVEGNGWRLTKENVDGWSERLFE